MFEGFLATSSNDKDRPMKPRKPVAKPAPAPPPPPPKVPDTPIKMLDEDETPYTVVKDSAEEEAIAKKNRTGFGRVADKFVRSARGPAAALLVMPSNLLLGQGALTGIIGLALGVIGAWPLIFTDIPTADDEYAEQMGIIFLAIICVAWAGVVCYGAFHMSKLDSYPWAFVGACFGLLPLLAGIFGLIALKDPRVIEGFKEPEGGPNQEEAAKKKAEEEEDDDDDDDEEEEEKPRKKKKKRS
jgi:hypothetical protein